MPGLRIGGALPALRFAADASSQPATWRSATIAIISGRRRKCVPNVNSRAFISADWARSGWRRKCGRGFRRPACCGWIPTPCRRYGSHDRALTAFREGKVQILLGTQMIAKGLDFPNVTLVGVINADTALHLPDFRAAERTFQLVTQVAGRTGRGDKGGRVLVQTFSPGASGDSSRGAARFRRVCARGVAGAPGASISAGGGNGAAGGARQAGAAHEDVCGELGRSAARGDRKTSCPAKRRRFAFWARRRRRLQNCAISIAFICNCMGRMAMRCELRSGAPPRNWKRSREFSGRRMSIRWR